ncbi:MAG: leucine-rich repeat domain-containing protein, partial [Clostridia bacterium]|nr:leucine-rich repeat domain-containing protein [Clostridia bacterium]
MDEPRKPAQLKKEWNMKKQADGTLRLNSYKGFDTEIEVPSIVGKDAVTVIGEECMAAYSIYSHPTSAQIAHRKTITAVTIPEGVTEIGAWAFYRCERLERVTLPSTLKFIGERAFFGCDHLHHVYLPPGVTVESGAFGGCTGLADTHGVVILGGILFDAGKSADLTVPDGVIAIDPDAFADALGLRHVTFPSSLKSLPPQVLYHCDALQTATIPPSVETIGHDPFPFGRHIRVYGYTGSAAELVCMESPHCLQFQSTGVIQQQNTDFVIADGVLTRYRGHDKEVIVPDGVRAITSFPVPHGWNRLGAFEGNQTVERVVISDSVRSIAGRAFARCTHLRDICLPDTLLAVEVSAFEETPWLAAQPPGALYVGGVLLRCSGDAPELVVRPGTKAIGEEACRNLSSLTKVILPEGLERIGRGAFEGCTALKEIVLPDSVKEVGDDAFAGVTLERCGGNVLHQTDKLSARFKAFYNGTPEDTAWLVLYQPDAAWRKAVRTAIDNAPALLDTVIQCMAGLIEAMPEPDRTACNRAGAFALEMYKGVGPEALQRLYHVLQVKKQPIVQKLAAD